MDLETIFATGKKVKLADKEVTIKQVALEDVPLLSDLFSKAMGEGSLDAKLLALAKNDIDLVIEILSKLTDLTKEDIKRLNIAAIVYFVSEIMKENAIFLEQYVTPMVEEVAKFVGGLTKSKP